jgi:RNA polymerase-binding transcription factor DksA
MMRRLLNELRAAAESQLSAPDVAQDSEAGSGELSADARQRARELLNDIEAAQQRIADGSYGSCFGCGRAIPVSRLRALPCSRYCATCDRLVRGGLPHPIKDVPDDGRRPTA